MLNLLVDDMNAKFSFPTFNNVYYCCRNFNTMLRIIIIKHKKVKFEYSFELIEYINTQRKIYNRNKKFEKVC